MMKYSTQFFGLQQGSANFSVKSQSINIFSFAGHTQLCPCSTQTKIRQKRMSVAWQGSNKLYGKAMGQMWPEGCSLPQVNQIVISTLTQENRPSGAHWYNIRSDAILAESTKLVKLCSLPSLTTCLQQVLNACQTRLRGLAMFKLTRITKWTLLRHGEAETAQVSVKYVASYPCRNIALYI